MHSLLVTVKGSEAMLLGEEVIISMPWGNIAGKAWGSVDGEPVLCLHGYQDNAATFDQLLPRLLSSRNYYLAIDLPGHGQSSHYPPSSQISFFEMLTDIRRICLFYNWSSITIIAHSLGSRLAIYFAGAYPNLVKMLILMEVGPKNSLHDPAHISAVVQHEIERVIRCETEASSEPHELMLEEAYRKFKDSRQEELSDKLLYPIFERSIRKVGEKVQFTKDKRNVLLVLPLITKDFDKALHSTVVCPTLIIISHEIYKRFEKSEMSLFDSVDHLKETLQNKLTLVMASCSHYIPIEASEEIAPLIIGFMKLKNKL